jgi:RimJ/RimL family protein N-acetyltransferase
VTLSLAAMTPQWSDEVATWRYDAPFEVYNGTDSSPAALLDGNHLAILDDGRFIGYVATGLEARVRGGPPDVDGVTDVGIGLAPDVVSRGLGARAATLALEALRVAGHRTLRASILASNERSTRLASGLGFVESGHFEDDEARRFSIYEIDLDA